MIAYANYYSDARIKAYVKSLGCNDIETDVIALNEKNRDILKKGDIYYISEKYQGESTLKYFFSYFTFFIKAFVKLLSLQFKKKYNIIHVHNMPNFIVFAAVIPKLLGARIILDVHDLMTCLYQTKFSVPEKHWLIKILRFEQIFSAAFADMVFCADHFQKETLIIYGIPEEKITVFMNVANEEIFKPVQKIRKNNRFKLVYHGTITERQGIDILIRAIGKIKNQIPVFLSIYGEGDFLEDSIALSRELGLEKNIYFSKSFFPVEKIPEIVSENDIGVVPNKKNMATDKFMMPVKLMEYVYLQTPVIAPRLKIIQHYFDDDMVKYFDPGNVDDLANCIVELYENPDLRASLVKNANRFVDKFNWKSQEETYLKLISN